MSQCRIVLYDEFVRCYKKAHHGKKSHATQLQRRANNVWTQLRVKHDCKKKSYDRRGGAVSYPASFHTEALDLMMEWKMNASMLSNYYPPNGYETTTHRLDGIARVLLMAVYDDEHPLSIFRGMRYLIEKMWRFTIEFNRHHYSPYIRVADNPFLNNFNVDGFSWRQLDEKSTAFKEIPRREFCHSRRQLPKFPQPLRQEININMMPIQMDKDTLSQQLPRKLHGYIPFLLKVMDCDYDQRDTICYLTIHESFVKKGRTQRRPGLHVECPGNSEGEEAEYDSIWGGGYAHKDGIYMASNISDSCAVWNCTVNDIVDDDDDDMDKLSVIDGLGNIEHLRSVLGNDRRYLLEAGKLYWITDRTPHEALPMKQDGWRQFFRLVSSNLGVWYEQHSTKNPMGIVPDPEITKIIKHNKFEKK